MDQVREGRIRAGRQARRGLRALLLLAVLLAGPAGAAERFGLVGAVDHAARTMTIDGRAYEVRDDTEIRDREGEPLPFSAFPAPGELEAVAVYYDAEGEELRSVRLTDLPR